MNFAVVGGDRRQISLCETLRRHGHGAVLAGTEKLPRTAAPACAPWRETVSHADAVILPFPAESCGGTLNAPFAAEPLKTEEVLVCVRPGTLVFGGKLAPNLVNTAGELGLRVFDYGTREELAIRNAVPSAEGAIQIAMEQLDVTIRDTPCLVIGYGRIGKALSSMLSSLGARVAVSARKPGDLAWIRFCGCEPLETGGLADHVGRFRAVFNTVPAMIMNDALLEKTDPNALIVDLASAPGGVDYEAAGRRGIRAVAALGLPGRVAPESAGIAIAETVLHWLEEGT